MGGSGMVGENGVAGESRVAGGSADAVRARRRV